MSPPTPVVEMIPDGVARPYSLVAASTWPQVQPPPTRTVSFVGVDDHVGDPGEVDHHAVIDDPEPAAVVAAAAYRHRRPVGARERDAATRRRRRSSSG